MIQLLLIHIKKKKTTGETAEPRELPEEGRRKRQTGVRKPSGQQEAAPSGSGPGPRGAPGSWPGAAALRAGTEEAWRPSPWPPQALMGDTSHPPDKAREEEKLC
jgi:hypothetical protein